jgi:hypothetical protein
MFFDGEHFRAIVVMMTANALFLVLIRSGIAALHPRFYSTEAAFVIVGRLRTHV